MQVNDPVRTKTVFVIAMITALIPACDNDNRVSPSVFPASPDDPGSVVESDSRFTASDRMTLPELGVSNPLAEECCTQPGSASECWMTDAQEDGVLCSNSAQCDSGSCNAAKGRCRCSADDECNNGVCMDGVCGPSWCNGYLKCSCWGGCEWWATDPAMTLHDLAALQGLYCCEGIYAKDPIDIDPSLGGYFTPNPCGGCNSDAQCNDNNPCTRDTCDDGACTYVDLNGMVDTVPSAADCPFNDEIYSSDCARRRCNSGVCSVDVAFNEGAACTDGPGELPTDGHADCYTAVCGDDGVCNVTIHDGDACRVGVNPCSDSRCDSDAACNDRPLNAAGLSAHPECCNPTVAASFNDGYPCTDDYCCYDGHASATCDGATAYFDRNVPNYNPASPGNCCKDSNHCFDGNSCTRDICCNAINETHPACGEAKWECAATIEDIPGCCDAAPANLADNCVDAYACTRNVCCDAATIAAATPGEPCYGADDNNCAEPEPFAVLPAGCCDPSNGDADCDDSNACTLDVCNPLTLACRSIPQPEYTGCCGPNPGQSCEDDGNTCTLEVCCDAVTVATAAPGDPCHGADPWNCTAEISSAPGCCVDAADCNDGNPCTEDTCVANRCASEVWTDLAAHPGCCNVGSWDSPDCTDGNDPGGCTQNICCSDVMVASAVAGDACFGRTGWSCTNPVEDPLPQGCCTPATLATDCNPDGNPCVFEACSNNNCEWTINPAGAPLCCEDISDCPSAGAARPCLEGASCDTTLDPLLNADFGQCQLTFKAQGTVCGASGDCYAQVCDDPASEDWTCSAVSYVPAFGEVGAQQCDPPTAQCGRYWCDGVGGCTVKEDILNDYDNDTCVSAEVLGAGASLFASGDNECGAGNFEPLSSGRFDECAGVTKSDVVYSFDDAVADSYELVHRAITATDTTGGRNPVVYARGDCDAQTSQIACNDNCTFDGSNYNTGDYGGFIIGECSGNESTVITGPFAVDDVPNHQIPGTVPVAQQDFDRNNVRDGYDVTRDRTTHIIVDSRATNPDYGGTFDLTVDQEIHNNNDCRQIGSYSAPPLIDGEFQWKQRWRGSMINGEYDNYYGAGGPTMGYAGGATTATNPHQAFFKVDIPAGSGRYLAYVDWYGLEELGESGYVIAGDAATAASSNMVHATLSHVKRSAADEFACSNVAGDISSSSLATGHAPQILLDTGAVGWASSWLAVGNRLANDYGDYELTLVKQQNPFFGFFTGYSDQAGNQCGTLDHFDAESVRLDLIPSGSTENGYLVTVTEQGGGTGGPDATTCAWTTARGYNLNSLSWLVSPDCYAADALSFTRWDGNAEYQVWATLPFKFPMGDKFYDRVYFDTTGRLEPRETFGPCASDAACTASYSECAGGLCTCLAAFGNQCVFKSGGYVYEPGAREIFAPHSAGGHAPVLSAAWGAFDLKWNKVGNKGYMTAQTVVFEGTLAYVISWVGMDVSSTTGNFDKLPPTKVGGSWLNTDWLDYRDRANFQVILRIDGRVAYYYGPVLHKQVWDEVVDRGAFVIAATGGIATTSCSDVGDCSVYGDEAVCDNNDPSRSSFRCYRAASPLVRDEDTGDLLPGLGNE